VAADYNGMVTQLSSGPCIALEVAFNDDSLEATVDALRASCGPADTETAKTLRPESLRALYGCGQAENAIHCTDLKEDAPLEVEYFFKVLQDS